MIDTYEDMINKELKIDCKKCFGLCCTALYFSVCDGFPEDKAAGKPCINLQSSFACSVHKNLRENGLKGCISYDCFGAGQKIAQITFKEHDWQKHPEIKEEMFEAFLIMRQLHEMLWYLTEAFSLQTNMDIKRKIDLLINDTQKLTYLSAQDLINLDVDSHRDKVNGFLRDTSEMIRSKINGKKSKRFDYFGADLRKLNLRGADLRGACLIAANLKGADLNGADFIGADLRDADFSGATLENSIFLTQGQINAAKGNSKTKLPEKLSYPEHWEKTR
ncbi:MULTISPECIES: pentapeptide repeat-containing protein [Clostridium]|uniref:pentapeptide repeat-containing protein n=1 Tax=Clostridium TaxID=1485 RepID=UPI000825A451|nr:MULTISPECIES: pentapeptide repeat-containing protein [Clostridium]PJI10501.1 pentapeptide repeat-containing protein [Clostridium sp. CT7]